MRKRPKYTMRCKACFKTVGFSPHNFADKMFYCSEGCLETGNKRERKYMEMKKNEVR